MPNVNVVFLTDEDQREIMNSRDAVSLAPQWVWSYPKTFTKTTWKDENTKKDIKHSADVFIYHFCDEPHPRDVLPEQMIVWQHEVEPPWSCPDCMAVLSDQMVADAQQGQLVIED